MRKIEGSNRVILIAWKRKQQGQGLAVKPFLLCNKAMRAIIFKDKRLKRVRCIVRLVGGRKA